MKTISSSSIPNNTDCAKKQKPRKSEDFHDLYRNPLLISGYFLHREAFKGIFYSSQIRSKYERFLDSTYGEYFKPDQIYQEIHKKHLKKTYAGKPTKKYLKLKQRLKKADSIDFREIEKELIYGKQ